MGGNGTGDAESAGELPDGDNGLVPSGYRFDGSPLRRGARPVDVAPGTMNARSTRTNAKTAKKNLMKRFLRGLRDLRGLRGFMIIVTVIFGSAISAHAEDGYELWLRYHRISDAALLKQYRSAITGIVV